jgi:hypothetical protein
MVAPFCAGAVIHVAQGVSLAVGIFAAFVVDVTIVIESFLPIRRKFNSKASVRLAALSMIGSERPQGCTTPWATWNSFRLRDRIR